MKIKVILNTIFVVLIWLCKEIISSIIYSVIVGDIFYLVLPSILNDILILILGISLILLVFYLRNTSFFKIIAIATYFFTSQMFSSYWYFTKFHLINHISYYGFLNTALILTIGIIFISKIKLSKAPGNCLSEGENEINKEKTSEEIKEKSQGFNEVYAINEKKDDLLEFQERVESTVKSIIDTKDVSNSISIFINGSWGSGKTSYMNLMKRELIKYRINFFDFNPWCFSSDNTYLTIFYENLMRELSVEYSIKRKIKKYISSLSNSVNNIFIKIGLLFIEKESIEDNFNQIRQYFSFKAEKCVVFIDDLDRLTYDELQEVLKIIRNTANIPYLFFMTAIDISNVEKLLNKNNVDKSDHYLKKFYQSRIDLPANKIQEIIDLFKEDISSLLSIEVEDLFFVNTLNNLSPRDIFSLTDYIRLKKYLIDAADMDVKDYITLCILKFHFENVYNFFEYNLEKVLDKKPIYTQKVGNSSSSIQCYCYSQSLLNKYFQINPKVEIPHTAEQILKYMFPPYDNKPKPVTNGDLRLKKMNVITMTKRRFKEFSTY